jgi:hypothetical protein
MRPTGHQRVDVASDRGKIIQGTTDALAGLQYRFCGGETSISPLRFPCL